MRGKEEYVWCAVMALCMNKSLAQIAVPLESAIWISLTFLSRFRGAGKGVNGEKKKRRMMLLCCRGVIEVI